MPTPITGDPTLVSDTLTRSISGATNASPIVIQTTSVHGYYTGDRVTITGVLGNTAANGSWLIVVTNATHFQLVGSTGSGAYTSGGSVVDRSLTPAFNIPSDGDPRNAASVDVALEALANRTQFLAKALQTNSQSIVYTANGSFFPEYDGYVLLVGCGGGAAGANGATPGNTVNRCATGGAGGGSALLDCFYVPVLAGAEYQIVVGAGGVVTGTSPGNRGGPGGDTIFYTNLPIFGLIPLAKFSGAGGGVGGHINDSTLVFQFAFGGRPVPTPAVMQLVFTLASDSISLLDASMGYPGTGGYASQNNLPSSAGSTSLQAYAGGAFGAGGLDAGSGGGRGGGGGGGGAGGPFGVGGAGGAGGESLTGTGFAAGHNGVAAAVNTGAGGGGGGAQGYFVSVVAGHIGLGAAGGSGKLILMYQRSLL